MRAIRLTKSEVAYILKHHDSSNKDSCSIQNKIKEASEVSTNPSVQPLEAILISAAAGRVIPLGNPASYARASRQCGLLNINRPLLNGQMQQMGEWISKQAWLSSSHLTMLDVLAKWPNWWPKVEYENTRQSSGRSSVENTGRRPAQGLR